MRMSIRHSLSILCLAACHVLGCAGTGTVVKSIPPIGENPPPGIDPALWKTVDALVAKLGSEEWAVREVAQKEIEALPVSALEAVKVAVGRSTDAEIKYRGERAIRRLVQKASPLAPFAYWKFDESSGNQALDSSGNANTGVISGNAAWTAGKVNSALSFDGTTNYVTIANQDHFNFDANMPFSISLWINPTDLNATRMLFTKMLDDNICQGYAMQLQGGCCYMCLYNSFNGGNPFGIGVKTNALTPNSWAFLAVTYDGSGRAAGMNVYVNGIKDTTIFVDNLGGRTTLNNVPVTIGHRGGVGPGAGGSKPFQGSMDEVKVCSRAITEAEIQAEYNATK
jgi:hypothetical protein